MGVWHDTNLTMVPPAHKQSGLLPQPSHRQVYGVGEESGAELTHAVVELLFTTSIE